MAHPRLYDLPQYHSAKAVLAEVRKHSPETHTNTVFVYVATDSNSLNVPKIDLYGPHGSPFNAEANQGISGVGNVLAAVGMPTVHLPLPSEVFLAGQRNKNPNPKMPNLAYYAIESLYRAFGAGKDFALAGIEANLGFATTPENYKLHNWYQAQIALFKAFAEAEEDKRLANFKDPSVSHPVAKLNDSGNGIVSLPRKALDLELEQRFFEAYQDGKKSLNNLAETKDPDFYAPFKPREVRPDIDMGRRRQEYTTAVQTLVARRPWKTALAIIASILILPLAPLFYYLWKKSRDSEAFQEVKIAPVDMFAISQLRRALSGAERDRKQIKGQQEIKLDRLNRDEKGESFRAPPIIRPVDEFVNPDQEHSYLVDAAFLQRHFNIFGKKLGEAKPTRTVEEKREVVALKKESCRLVREELQGLQPR